MNIKQRLARFHPLSSRERRRFLRRLLILGFAIIATLLPLVDSILKFSDILFPSPSSATTKLEELDRVRASLRELDRFVASQQESIASTSATLRKLEHERTELDKVVSVNREAVEALLRYQARSQARAAWFGYIMSFILGVLSSLTATLLITFRRKATAPVSIDLPTNTTES